MAVGFHVAMELVCDWLLPDRLAFFPQLTSVEVRQGSGYVLLESKMPKRTCPFPETFTSQYKIHIGQQELSNYGVFGNMYRQEIYGKHMYRSVGVLANVSFVMCLLSQHTLNTFVTVSRFFFSLLLYFYRLYD